MKNTDSKLNPKEVLDLKNEFLSVVKHEFRTPMVLIEGYCEMLTDLLPTSNLTQEQLECIKNISNGVTQLGKIIDDILDMYLLESDQMQFSADKISVPNFMMKIIKDFSNITKQKKVILINSNTVNLDITLDEKKLAHVFHNMIENSLSFIPSKNGRIEIGSMLSKNTIIFFVKDNGFGIPKEKQSNIFQKFFQVDSTYKRRHFGIGLGLALSKEIIEKMGGKIWLESDNNTGSTFYFSIPIKK